MTIEREVENLFEQMLKKKEYIFDYKNIKRNVYYQKPKYDSQIKKLNGLRPDYIIYRDDKNEDILCIAELKKPGENLKDAYIQLKRYCDILNVQIGILFDGIQLLTYNMELEKKLELNGIEVLEVLPVDIYLKFEKNETSNLILDQTVISSKEELIRIFEFANNKMRKAGLTKGMDRFFEFSTLLFLKLVSEDNIIFKQNIPEYIKWEFYNQKKGIELYNYINDTVIPFLEKKFNSQSEEGLFSKIKINDYGVLSDIVSKLSTVNLTEIKTDIKGDAFEYFIQKYNSANNDLGEYFTPRHIVNFMIEIINPQFGEKIYDPFCGTGGMLISSFNYVYENLKKEGMLFDSTLEELRKNTLYGSEISDNARIAKMNMILTGDGHSNIIQQNTLLADTLPKYDIIISNIPFNLEGMSLNKNILEAKNGNVQAILHIIESMDKKNGRAAIIVPDSVLANDDQDSIRLRKYLVDKNIIQEIVSLPSGVFLPYTEAKSSILIFNNNKIETNIKISRISNDGYTLTSRRRKKLKGIDDIELYLSNDLDKVQIDFNEIKNKDNYSFLWFKYINVIKKNFIELNEIIEFYKEKNLEGYSTYSISNSVYYGFENGEDYWGTSFESVTSASNSKYSVVYSGSIAYNPSRANVGSIGINILEKPCAVSTAYKVFKIINPNYLPEYVYLCMKSKMFIKDIKERSYGTVRQNLGEDDLKKLSIPILSIEEQKKYIESYRSKYDKYFSLKNELEDFDIIDLIE